MKRIILFTAIILFVSFQGISQFSLAFHSTKINEDYNKFKKSTAGSNLEFQNRSYGVDLNYIYNWFVGNFQSGYIHFNRELEHTERTHKGGGSSPYFGEVRVESATIKYGYLSNRIGFGYNYSTKNSSKDLRLMLSIIGFYQSEVKLFANESNHVSQLTTKQNVGEFMGPPIYSIKEYPNDYTPFQMAIFKKLLHYPGIDFTTKIIYRKYFIEFGYAIGYYNNWLDSYRYNYTKEYSITNHYKDSKVNFLSLKIGMFLGQEKREDNTPPKQ